jgi:uncharacterized integral membrane protein
LPAVAEDPEPFDFPTAPTEPAGRPAPGAAESAAVRKQRARLYILAAISVVLVAVLIALVAANTREVKVSWVIGSTEASLVWIIFATAVVGWLLGIATAALFRRRARRER